MRLVSKNAEAPASRAASPLRRRLHRAAVRRPTYGLAYPRTLDRSPGRCCLEQPGPTPRVPAALRRRRPRRGSDPAAAPSAIEIASWGLNNHPLAPGQPLHHRLRASRSRPGPRVTSPAAVDLCSTTARIWQPGRGSAPGAAPYSAVPRGLCGTAAVRARACEPTPGGSST